MGLTRVWVIVGVLLLLAVLSVGALFLREFRDITTDMGRPIQLAIIEHPPAPTPTLTPSPNAHYRALAAIPAARDTSDGTSSGTAHARHLTGSAGYGWLDADDFHEINREPAGIRRLYAPGCDSTAQTLTRYAYAYPDAYGDVAQWEITPFNYATALIQVNTYTDGADTYRVYVHRDQLLCTVIGGAIVEVSP